MIADALIQSPAVLFAFLAVVVAAIFWLGEREPLRPFFRFCPPLIWTYFVPMICSTLKIIPHASELYDPFMLRVVLPVVIVLLLVPSETGAIARLGGKAIVMMLIGTLGIVVGAAAGFALFTAVLPAGSLPQDAWKGIASLSASWIGGSANMAAVAASLGTDKTLFGKMVVVDTVCAYTWLGILIASSNWQGPIDRLNRADSRVVHDLALRLSQRQAQRARPIELLDFVMLVAIGFGVSQVCLLAGTRIGVQVDRLEAAGGIWQAVKLSQVLSGFGWGILLITAAGIALSFTRLRNLDDAGATPIGYAGLYLLLTTFGAQADLRLIRPDDVWLFAIGATWLAIHVVILLAAARLLRAPLFLMATSSMANVGGTASTPVVAAAFHPSLAPVGLLMAILGGILGTPIALLVVAKICAAIAGNGG
jgi:uncharacterized membrane protein